MIDVHFPLTCHFVSRDNENHLPTQGTHAVAQHLLEVTEKNAAYAEPDHASQLQLPNIIRLLGLPNLFWEWRDWLSQSKALDASDNHDWKGSGAWGEKLQRNEKLDWITPLVRRERGRNW